MGFVRMGFTCIDLEFAELRAAETGLRDHSPNGAFDEKDWAALTDDSWSFHLLSTNVAREAGVNLRRLLGSGQDHLISIDDDDKVTGINM